MRLEHGMNETNTILHLKLLFPTKTKVLVQCPFHAVLFLALHNFSPRKLHSCHASRFFQICYLFSSYISDYYIDSSWAVSLYLKVKMNVTQSCLTLYNPMDYTVYGILQTRTLEWVAMPFSRESSQPRDRTQVSCIAGRFFTI